MALVMLDLDNTLNDRAGALADWAAAFCAHRSLNGEAVAWMVENDADGYRDRTAVFTAARERFGLDEDAAELRAAYEAEIRTLLRPVAGAHQCLKDLRAAGHSLAIVTNGRGLTQQHKVDALGFRDLVDAVVVSEEVGVAKPEPAIFELAASRAGGTLSGAWMAGDSGPHDILGAQQLGLRSAWIHRGRTWVPTQPGPTATIGALDELVPIVAAAAGTR